MSKYRELIEKLTEKQKDQHDFDELCTPSKDIMNELADVDRERLTSHMNVILALALHANNGSIDKTEEYLKKFETYHPITPIIIKKSNNNNNIYQNSKPIVHIDNSIDLRRYIVYSLIFAFVFTTFIFLLRSVRR